MFLTPKNALKTHIFKVTLPLYTVKSLLCRVMLQSLTR